MKGLLLEVLRKVDEVLDSKYYQNALRARATTDMLIGSVSQVALNHIGMLLVDEIQNVANSKKLVARAKEESMDIVEVLKTHIPVVEVSV